ncbi:MAG: phosphomethylpyrimidine synthase ThiC [Candidatus Omnitrophica bacterium]|nr:phosphomethylpyrimidine synthase ThiC [Candidatus Omnitrophota bacterium]
MRQINDARRGHKAELIKRVAKLEGVSSRFIIDGLKKGTIVIPANRLRNIKTPCAIGKGLRTKINANIGTSPYYGNVSEELKKLDICVKYHADTVMDLSTSNDFKAVLKSIIKKSPMPVGTVPLYEVAVRAKEKNSSFAKTSVDDIFFAIQRQAEEGVDFFTIHAGVTEDVLGLLKKHGRIAGIVSRGGALMAKWMKKNKRENPLYENFDRVLSIAKEYDIALSLGDGLRPGSVCDATDKPQIAELKILGKLARRAKEKGVQVMIEGPGHVPINQIEKNIKLQKKLCNNAPFYVLGPLVTDVAPGYDHITSAIGASLAGYYGADFLCYVTPAEHLSIPTLEDVKEGLIAYRIAAHSADIAKGIKDAKGWDKTVSIFRTSRDWKRHIKASMDPEKAEAIHKRFKTETKDICSMCGEYCPLKISEKI